MTLYYIIADDENGDNRDLFVRADSPEIAAKLMLWHYEILREDIDKHGIRVMEVPPVDGPSGAVLWEELFKTETRH